MHPTHYRFRHYRQDGPERRLIWASGVGEVNALEGSREHQQIERAQLWTPNDLANQGEQNMLAHYFQAAAVSANLYVRLYNDTPVATDTLADLLGEVTGAGYAPLAFARNSTDWPTLALDTGDYKITSATKTFTATGDWTSATYLVLATTTDNTGLLVAFAPLSTTRTLVNGDTLDVSVAVKLQGSV